MFVWQKYIVALTKDEFLNELTISEKDKRKLNLDELKNLLENSNYSIPVFSNFEDLEKYLYEFVDDVVFGDIRSETLEKYFDYELFFSDLLRFDWTVYQVFDEKNDYIYVILSNYENYEDLLND